MAIPNHRGSPEAIQRQANAVQAFELRKSGASFRQIAEQLGYADESGARKAVMALLKKQQVEAVEDYRKVELARLDAMLLAIAQQVRQGHLGAIDRALKIMERRARLLGLDAPTKIAPTTPDGQQTAPLIQFVWMDMDDNSGHDDLATTPHARPNGHSEPSR